MCPVLATYCIQSARLPFLVMFRLVYSTHTGPTGLFLDAIVKSQFWGGIAAECSSHTCGCVGRISDAFFSKPWQHNQVLFTINTWVNFVLKTFSLPILLLLIGHFRVPKTLTFKTRQSTKCFLSKSFICMRINNHFISLSLALKQRLRVTLKWSIAFSI